MSRKKCTRTCRSLLPVNPAEAACCSVRRLGGAPARFISSYEWRRYSRHALPGNRPLRRAYQYALRPLGPGSVDERPSVRSIEPAYFNRLLEPWIEVVEIHTVLAPGLRPEWLPVRSASAGLATHVAQRLVAPDVL